MPNNIKHLPKDTFSWVAIFLDEDDLYCLWNCSKWFMQQIKDIWNKRLMWEDRFWILARKPTNIRRLKLHSTVMHVPSSLLWLEEPFFPDRRAPPLPPSLQTYMLHGSTVPPKFPNSLTSLSLSFWNKPLQKNLLPGSLTSLSLRRFDWRIEPGVFPDSLCYLSLERFDHELVPGVLPPNLTCLECKDFNRPLKVGILPLTLQSLTLSAYTEPLPPEVLPPSLTYLCLHEFDADFAPSALPLSLTKLCLGPLFRSDLTYLPSLLQTLEFPQYGRFHQPNAIYPPSLTHLELPSQCMVFWFPANLKTLACGEQFYFKDLPGNLTDLHLLGSRGLDPYDNAPSSLTRLQVDGFLNVLKPYVNSIISLQLVRFNGVISRDLLPSGLQSLELDIFDSPLGEDAFPPCLTSLRMMQFNHELWTNVLPCGLRYLHLNLFDKGIRFGVLPDSIVSLSLRKKNAESYPTSLTELKLSSRTYSGYKLTHFLECEKLRPKY
jgi:hypothetical protein